jgi:hypothetical protein
MYTTAAKLSHFDPLTDVRGARLLESLDRQIAGAGQGANGWMPVSTAPRDGTMVLLWAEWQNGPAGPAIGLWDERRKVWNRLGSTRAIARRIVTHWASLPGEP